ncbi:MAG: DNA-directed RNA polymerase subunit omega [Clostridia bacterium]|nr:DNA-directed RNA polymerase subunit omega [Clostridia bacterium]MBR3594431.1 DNA-directed RNA polymerase subunit omega [Clostridia bacterium]
MLNPAIGELIEIEENRYQLVLKIAKEARTISEEAQKNEEIIVEKPVSLAINKLAAEHKN